MHSGFPVDFFAFKSIFPACKLDCISPDIDFAEEEFSSCSLESIIEHMNAAIHSFTQAMLYEHALALYSMLIQIYTFHQMLGDLLECYKKSQALTETLIAANQETRLTPTYFRVAFFGTPLREEDGQEYIYRMEAKENLMTVQKYFKEILQKTFNVADEEDIEVLGNKSIERSALEPGHLYLQVAKVSPFHEEKETSLTSFQTHFAIGK
jgi:hypothetical protein